MFGHRTILRAPADGAPEGTGGQAPAPTQSALPLADTPAPPAPAEPAKPKIDPADPELRKLIAAAVKKAAEESAAAERAKIEEEKKLAQLDAESRAKAEKKKAEDEAAAARAEAEQHKTSAEFARGLLRSGLVPQTDLAESMALAAPKELVSQGAPWAEAVTRVGKEHGYLFKSSAAPAPAATPKTVQDARTLSTGGSSQPGNGGNAATVSNAFDMTPEQWAKAQADIRAGKKPA